MRRALVALVVGLIVGLTVPSLATLHPQVLTGDWYQIQVETSTNGSFSGTSGVKAWNARYYRNLPYSPGVEWIDGDRCSYRGAYGFLTLNDQIVGRFTFLATPGTSGFVQINDKYMGEGQRYYDGSPGSGDRSLNDCPGYPVALESFSGSELPTINFEKTDGTVLEIRDYKTLSVGPGITFQQIESTPTRITVAAYKNGLPIVVVYYDSLSPDVVLTSDLSGC